MLRVYGKGFLIKLGGVLGIESLLEELTPAEPVIGILRVRGHQSFEFVVCAFEILRAPQCFRALKRLRGKSERECKEQNQRACAHLSILSCTRASSISRAVNCFL